MMSRTKRPERPATPQTWPQGSGSSCERKEPFCGRERGKRARRASERAVFSVKKEEKRRKRECVCVYMCVCVSVFVSLFFVVLVAVVGRLLVCGGLSPSTSST